LSGEPVIDACCAPSYWSILAVMPTAFSEACRASAALTSCARLLRAVMVRLKPFG
jgi:hypothetical protein